MLNECAFPLTSASRQVLVLARGGFLYLDLSLETRVKDSLQICFWQFPVHLCGCRSAFSLVYQHKVMDRCGRTYMFAVSLVKPTVCEALS